MFFSLENLSVDNSMLLYLEAKGAPLMGWCDASSASGALSR
jgi:hypothetical protein